jgi:hypothetical protein
MLNTTSRRLRLATIVGAVLAIGGLLAVPAAASAAETQNCATGTTPTPETQPWQTFVDSGNPFDVVYAGVVGFEDDVKAALLPLGPLTTPADLLAAHDAITAAVTTLQISFNSTALSDSTTALTDGLLAADPANEATWTAALEAMTTKLDQDVTDIDFNTAFGTYITNISDYLDSVQDALTANPPTAPGTVPPSVSDSGVVLANLVAQLAQLAQVDLYDAAAAQVVYAQECTTVVADVPVEPTDPIAPTAPALANTGASDGMLLGTIAALLLLAGATASVLVARHQRAN